jgi:hypothetical protein
MKQNFLRYIQRTFTARDEFYERGINGVRGGNVSVRSKSLGNKKPIAHSPKNGKANGVMGRGAMIERVKGLMQKPPCIFLSTNVQNRNKKITLSMIEGSSTTF